MTYTHTGLGIIERGRHHRAKMRLTVVALAVLAVLLCGWQNVLAVIVFDSASSISANTDIITLQHTTGAGVDPILVVGVSVYSANKPVAGITYGGVPLGIVVSCRARRRNGADRGYHGRWSEGRGRRIDLFRRRSTGPGVGIQFRGG